AVGAGPALAGAALAVHGVEVDDVAQQHFPVLQGLVPRHDGLDSQRAFADAADHHFPPRLDTLGDGDLPLAREQFHAAHFAQVHAHGVVGAAKVRLREVAGGAGLVLIVGVRAVAVGLV